MQFVPNGPEIPETLLQAHEEGRVIFFCGAGISYPAGLPGFQGLVDSIFAEVGTTPDPIERQAYDRGQFDATLDLLERRLPGQRLAVRRGLAKALQPKLRRKRATSTHAALLELSRKPDGALRLVTTNFDHLFEKTARSLKKPRRHQYWLNRVFPFWHKVWPKSRELASNRISDALARLAIAADDAFPKAFATVADWLSPIEHPHYVIHLLNEAGLAERFPAETLDFLNIIVNEQPWPDRELRAVLDAVVQASPALRQNRHYVRLDSYLRQHNA